MIEKIVAFIKDEIAMEPIDEIGMDEDLLGSGILDSMGMMKLVDFIEKERNQSIPEYDLTVENFMTLKRIDVYLNGATS